MDITVTTLVLAVRELAKEMPDYRYEKTILNSHGLGCYYTMGGDSRYEPVGCIIGQAIKIVSDNDPDVMRRLQVIDATGSASVDKLATKRIVISDDWAVLDWLMRVQAQQDNGVSWSECVEYADEHN